MSFHRDLGLSPGEEPASVRLEPRPEHEGPPGVVHFAILATLAEVAAREAAGGAVVPTQVSLQLMQRARLDRPLVGRGRVQRSGRHLVFAEGEVWQGDVPVAKATVIFARAE